MENIPHYSTNKLSWLNNGSIYTFIACYEITVLVNGWTPKTKIIYKINQGTELNSENSMQI